MTGTTGIAPPTSRAASTTARQSGDARPAGARRRGRRRRRPSPDVTSSASTWSRRPLRRVPGRPAVHHEHLAVAEVRRHGVLDSGPVLGPHDEHETAYVGEREGVAHRPDEHRHVAQRQQHLVDLGADPGAGAGGQDDDGRAGGHGRVTSAVAMAATPSPRPVRPSPSVVVAERLTGAASAVGERGGRLVAARAEARDVADDLHRDVADLPAGVAHAAGRLGQERDARGAGPLGLGGAEVGAEVAEPGRGEEGVAGGVRGDVGVRVALEPGGLVRPGEAGEVHRDAHHEPVHVGADADAGARRVSGL